MCCDISAVRLRQVEAERIGDQGEAKERLKHVGSWEKRRGTRRKEERRGSREMPGIRTRANDVGTLHDDLEIILQPKAGMKHRPLSP